jgi:hypothetical protein
MYGTIPDVVISKPPRNNQFRVVVALGVGVLIGALGTAMLFPASRPILAADPEIEMSDDLMECRNSLSGCRKQLVACASTSRPVTTSLAAMELDAQSNGCGADEIESCKKWWPLDMPDVPPVCVWTVCVPRGTPASRR